MSKEFLEGLRSDDVEKVRGLLRSNPDLLHMKTQEGSLILTAVYSGAIEVARYLSSKLPPLDIFEASALGYASRVAQILEKDKDSMEATYKSGFTPLGLAAFFGHSKVVTLLLEKGAELDRIMPSLNENTALDAAVANRQLEVVKLLLSKGAKANVRAAQGFSPLHKAAFRGDAAMLRLLISYGADVAAETDEGKTALDIAVERGHDEAARLLTQSQGS